MTKIILRFPKVYFMVENVSGIPIPLSFKFVVKVTKIKLT